MKQPVVHRYQAYTASSLAGMPLPGLQHKYKETVLFFPGRGPSMSATPGKVVVLGTQEVKGEKLFVLSFLRGRRREWVGRPFFAKYDAAATWLDQLKPAFGEPRFFFEDEPPERSQAVAWE